MRAKLAQEAAQRDERPVVAVADAPYLGSVLDDTTLIPSEQAWLGPTHFGEWLQRTVGAAARVG